MIARYWSAQTTRAKASAYLDHLKNEVLPDIRKLDGYSGVEVLEREIPEGVEIIVLTKWHSLDAIRGFAGADVEKAIVTAEAASLLTRFDHRVRHYEVAFREAV